MNSELRIVLSQEEFRLLTSVCKDSALNDLVDRDCVHGDSSVMLDLDRGAAERLRDLLTERLAEIGFDSEYSPTHTGKALEALIDKLFEP